MHREKDARQPVDKQALREGSHSQTRTRSQINTHTHTGVHVMLAMSSMLIGRWGRWLMLEWAAWSAAEKGRLGTMLR